MFQAYQHYFNMKDQNDKHKINSYTAQTATLNAVPSSTNIKEVN
jgi:hypothetical protein